MAATTVARVVCFAALAAFVAADPVLYDTTIPPTTTPSELGELKQAVVAGGWIPFTVVIVLSVIFSFVYVRYYQHKHERECGSTTIAILALTTALLVLALIPVDIFLVSSLKSSDGTFHDWATASVRNDVKNMLTYGYYAMYALTVVFVFFLLPMGYFFYEEKDEEAGTTTMQRILGALKYTAGFLIVMGILMCIGAFALNSDGTQCDSSSNGTDVQDWAKCKAEFAESSLTKDGGTNALSFTIGALTVIGFFYLCMYTAPGFVALPLEMIRSRVKASREDKRHAQSELRVNREKRDAITSKYGGKRSKLSGRERRDVMQSEARERTLLRAQERVEEVEAGPCGRLSVFCRPFEFILGIVFILLSLFLVISLLMTTLDKLLQINKQHLDFKTGYAQTEPNIVNPVDKALTVFSSVFPLDYIFMTLLVYFFVLCCLAGVRRLNVRVCCMKMFNIRPRRTTPQGLLFVCMILMFTVLALNVLLLSLAPSYVTYGNQRYAVLADLGNSSCVTNTQWPSSDTDQCSAQAPAYIFKLRTASMTYQIASGDLFNASSPSGCTNRVSEIVLCGHTDPLPIASVTCMREDACQQTRMAALLHAFFYNFWFLGAIYFWANWIFILVFFFCLFWFTCRGRQSIMQSMIKDVESDMNDSDDDMTPFNPSWK